MSQRICLVTAEFHGLFKNGGIGTANTGLALELAAAGHEVTVAYVDPAGWAGLSSNEAFLAQRKRWREEDIFLDFVPRWSRLKATVEDYCWAISTLEYLRARRFDVVLFNECGGQGHFALLAKRAGVYADAPRMIVVTHGASDWARELNAQLPTGYRSAALSFFERRSVELADLVVSPSHYLIGWMREHGWRLPAETHMLQNIVPTQASHDPIRSARKIDEIVFFGRLESRKGIDIFCDAISQLDQSGRLDGVNVTFLGKFSRVGSIHSGVFLLERSASWSVKPRILADLGQAEALDYLKRPGALAVIPSQAENSPCVVAECLIAGVPFLATNSGGTAELVAEVDRRNCLVAFDAQALRARIDQILAHGHEPAQLAEPQSDTRARWRAIVAESQAEPAAREPSPARVSVCISIRAGDEVDALTLESLRRQTHGACEIVVVAYGGETDGQTQGATLPPEIRIERRSPDRAGARNGAAAAACGDWLMFARAEGSILEPEAIETLLRAAERLGVQAISGLAYEYSRRGPLSPEWDGEIGALPFGPSPELAAFENSIGDDVFLISRRAFEKLGGYESGVAQAIEDRVLLTRALVAGIGVDLAPARIAWTRVGERGREDNVADMRRVLDIFRDRSFREFSHVLESVLSQGPQQIRARAAAWLAPLDEKARDLALKLTFNYPAGAAVSFEPFLRYILARGRFDEALDFARSHDPGTLTPIAEAAVARDTERSIRQSLRKAADKRPLILVLNQEIVERLRLISGPAKATIGRDDHCVASIPLLPGVTIAKAPLACPAGAERLETYVDFAGSGLDAEVAIAVAEPNVHALLTETELHARSGLWWSGWRGASATGVRLNIENIPASHRALDIFLLCRAALGSNQDGWSVWRHVTAHGSLSGLYTPSLISERETRSPLPLHILESGQLLSNADDFPFRIFTPGSWTLHHPLAKRISLVCLKGAVPPGAVGVRAAFSTENDRAHPIGFGFWIRQAGAPALDEASLADSAAFSGWTVCAKPFRPDFAEARLRAPANEPMDLYIATQVVGFDDVAFCHAVWREISVIESILA